MANENERHADIIAEMRNEGHTGPADALEWVREKMTYYADRLEAAHRRELDALQAQGDALRLGIEQYRQYNNKVVKECNSKLGNMAKLREAVEAFVRAYELEDELANIEETSRAYEMAREALGIQNESEVVK